MGGVQGDSFMVQYIFWYFWKCGGEFNGVGDLTEGGGVWVSWVGSVVWVNCDLNFILYIFLGRRRPSHPAVWGSGRVAIYTSSHLYI